MHSFLKLIRFTNLLFILLCLLLIRYSFFKSTGAALALSDLQYGLLMMANCFLGAAGYIINDLNDVAADKINKPHKLYIGKSISQTHALNWFFFFNIAGVGIGFYLANSIGYPVFSGLFIFTSALLYLYSVYLKNMPLIGSIAVSFLVAGVAALPGIFDLLPAITPENRGRQAMVFSILLDYSFFAFFVNFLRELVKDQEDLRGDQKAGGKSLPILLGISRSNRIIFAIGLIPIAGVVYYLFQYLFEHTLATLYALLLVLGPLIYFQIQILWAKEKKEFSRLSLILKIILFFGFISIGLHPFLIP